MRNKKEEINRGYLFPLNCSEVMKLSAVKNNSKNG